MSGLMKLLANIGMPIPRLADFIFVKDSNDPICNITGEVAYKQRMMERNRQYYTESITH